MREHYEAQLTTLNTEMIQMGALCEDAISGAIQALLEDDKHLAEKVGSIEMEIDQHERDIERLCMRLLLMQQPVATDLRVVSSALKMISDLERIGDQAFDISDITKHVSFQKYESKVHIKEMANAVIHMVTDSVDSYVKKDVALAKKVAAADDQVDDLFLKVRSELVELVRSNQDMAEGALDLMMIAKYLERIGDHAVNLLRVAREIHDKDLKFSEKAQQELEVFTGAIIEILNITTDAFVENNLQLSYEVEPLEQVIDSLKVELKNRHIRRLQEGKCTIELGFVLSDILNNFERVSDHCSNIAVCLIQIKDSTMDTHGYLNEIKTSGDPRFTGYYNRFTSKYTLPESRHKKASQEVPVKS